MKNGLLAYTTHTYATQHNKTKQHTSNRRAAYYFHFEEKIYDEVTRIITDCDECST